MLNKIVFSYSHRKQSVTPTSRTNTMRKIGPIEEHFLLVNMYLADRVIKFKRLVGGKTPFVGTSVHRYSHQNYPKYHEVRVR